MNVLQVHFSSLGLFINGVITYKRELVEGKKLTNLKSCVTSFMDDPIAKEHSYKVSS